MNKNMNSKNNLVNNLTIINNDDYKFVFKVF